MARTPATTHTYWIAREFNGVPVAGVMVPGSEFMVTDTSIDTTDAVGLRRMVNTHTESVADPPALSSDVVYTKSNVGWYDVAEMAKLLTCTPDTGELKSANTTHVLLLTDTKSDEA